MYILVVFNVIEIFWFVCVEWIVCVNDNVEIDNIYTVYIIMLVCIVDSCVQWICEYIVWNGISDDSSDFLWKFVGCKQVESALTSVLYM